MRCNIVVGMVGKYVCGILAVYSVLVAVDVAGIGLVRKFWCWYDGLGSSGGHWLLNLVV